MSDQEKNAKDLSVGDVVKLSVKDRTETGPLIHVEAGEVDGEDRIIVDIDTEGGILRQHLEPDRSITVTGQTNPS